MRTFTKVHIPNFARPSIHYILYIDEDFQPLSKPSLEAVSIPSIVPSVSILVTELEANIETNPHPSFLLQLFQFRMAHHNMIIFLSDLVSFCLRQFSTLHLFGEISAYEEAVASVKGMIKQLTKAIHDLLSLLPSLTTLFESVNEESSCDDLNDILFSKNLARISQSNPLRSISFLTISESITTLKAILTQMLGVIDMNLPCIDLLVLKGLPSFETIFHSSIDLCSRRYHLQARCLHHALLHIYRPKLPELIRISMTQRGFVDVMIHTPNTFAWIEQNFTYTAWETLKRLSVHQNCLLPKLELLLSKWAVLTREAAVLDQQFRSLHSLQDDAFSVHVYWTMLLVSQLMDACMSLMMQTQLVTPPELPSFFWCIYTFSPFISENTLICFTVLGTGTTYSPRGRRQCSICGSTSRPSTVLSPMKQLPPTRRRVELPPVPLHLQRL